MIQTIDPRSPVPLYAQIASRMRLAIAAGDVVAETRLPSVRNLASLLRVSPATVVKAYAALESDGLVETRGTLGVFARPLPQSRREAERKREARRLVGDLLRAATSIGVTSGDLQDAWRDAIDRAVGARE
jgi:DNA-binding transcriptional regulator YhcF (GntR family)